MTGASKAVFLQEKGVALKAKWLPEKLLLHTQRKRNFKFCGI